MSPPVLTTAREIDVPCAPNKVEHHVGRRQEVARPARTRWYAGRRRLAYKKATFAVVWALGAFAIGWGAHVTSVAGWAVLAGLGLIPPLILHWLWHEPPQSMSESIRAARR